MQGQIFVSYRRGDDPGYTHALVQRLSAAFGPEAVFMDVGSIGAGADFAKVLEQKVEACAVLLAVIGPRWLDARDGEGQRRLDQEGDFVRIEIALALAHGKHIVPVLVGSGGMPAASDLPETLKPLAHRNAVRLTHERFASDCETLVQSLRDLLGTQSRKARPSRRAVVAGAGAAIVAPVVGGAAWWLTRQPVEQPRPEPDLRPTIAAEAPLEGHTGSVEAVAWSPDSQTLYSSSKDKTLRAWDVAAKREIRKIELGGQADWLVVSPDGRRLLCGENPKAVLRDAESLRPIKTVGDRAYSGMAFDKTGSVAVLTETTGPTGLGPWTTQIRSFDISSDTTVATVSRYQGEVVRPVIALSRDGQMFAAALHGAVVAVSETRTMKEIRRFPVDGPVRAIAFSPNGDLLAVSHADEQLIAFALPSGRRVFIIERPVLYTPKSERSIKMLTFSGDGRLFCSVTENNSVQMRSLPSGHEFWDDGALYKDNADIRIETAAISPDRRYLVAAGSREQNPSYGIRVWRLY